MKPLVKLFLSIFIFSGFYSFCLNAQNIEKSRVIVLTDIEADPDDSQTLVRLLLYSNQIDIEGLIATTSTHQKKRVAPETIQKIIKGYEKIQPNLLIHEPGFPSSANLLSIIKQGLPVYGMAGVGEGKDSEGSDWIIKILEKEDDRALWISVWGGPQYFSSGFMENQENKIGYRSSKAN